MMAVPADTRKRGRRLYKHDSCGPQHDGLLQQTQLKLTLLTHHGMLASANPGPLDSVEFSGQPRRITDDHGMWWKASCNQGIGRYNTVTTDYQFAFAAYDCCSMPDPASLLDSNCASRGGALCLNRLADVFIGMIVIHDERAC